MKTNICQFCKNKVQRKVKNRKFTCYDCKKKKAKVRSLKRLEKLPKKQRIDKSMQYYNKSYPHPPVDL